MNRLTEKVLQAQIVEALEFCGWLVLEYGKPGGHRALAGAVLIGHADLLVIKDGRHVFLEVKMPEKDLSFAQMMFADLVRSFGAEYYVVRSLEDVKGALGLEQLELGPIRVERL